MALGGARGRQGVLGGRRTGCGKSGFPFTAHAEARCTVVDVSLDIQLVDPINQTAEEDALIPGLCALLLGVCYEFNREPGEVTRYVLVTPFPLLPSRLTTAHRATVHPILTRLGIDTLAGRIIHLRDDDRFKAVGPDSAVATAPSNHVPAHHPHQGTPSAGVLKAEVEEGEIWFDWAFVDFWKSNYCESLCLSDLAMVGAYGNGMYRHDTEGHRRWPQFTVICCRYVLFLT